MKNKIKENIGNPNQLEKLYRENKKEFVKSFFEIYPEISENKTAEFWKARLEFETNYSAIKINLSEIILLLISSLTAIILIQIPHIFNFNPENFLFYEKNAGLIVFLGLSIYIFLSRKSFNRNNMIFTFAVFFISAIYINFLPTNRESNSILLAYLHLPLMLWCLYGLVFINFDKTDRNLRIDYIKYNGDLAVIGAIIAIAGGILSGVTIGLFNAIGMKIEKLYFDYIVLSGIVSAPIVATFIVIKYPFVTNKIAPIISKIFSPLVLITLVIYLASIFIIGKDPYNDREFLIVFNVMLIGVMALIIFSVSETSADKFRFNEMTIFALSVVTLIIDLIALSSIVYRLGEYGFTPNRTVVLGSNLLIFGNLLLIMIDLYKVNFKNSEIKNVELTIAKYLPVYAIWTLFVVFILPVVFGMR